MVCNDRCSTIGLANIKTSLLPTLLKFGSTREQYFHVWRSFLFDENADTIDSYIHKVKQVAALLDYGEPQILELFKNTYPVDYIMWSIHK